MDALTPTVPVSEVFGPVWQGEGPHTGRVCWFVRLGECNLHCNWCDTPYTWDTTRFDVDSECPPMTGATLAGIINENAAHLAILSGGEPMIHQRNTALRLTLEETPDTEWHVETNGTITPDDYMAHRISHFTVSPKVNPQGDPEKRRIKPRTLARYVDLAHRGRAAFKVVCATPDDVQAAVEFYDEHDVPDAARWIMPEGTTPEKVLDTARLIAPTVTMSGVNLSLRQHALMYGNERGR